MIKMICSWKFLEKYRCLTSAFRYYFDFDTWKTR